MLCAGCGLTFISNTQNRLYCRRCRRISWEERNADAIELLMGEQGLTYRQAKTIVEANNRPKCLACGNTIHRGTKGRHFFCRKTAQCRRTARRYKWFREHDNLPKDVAVQKALEKLEQETAQNEEQDERYSKVRTG